MLLDDLRDSQRTAHVRQLPSRARTHQSNVIVCIVDQIINQGTRGAQYAVCRQAVNTRC
jgi:hypothetical protein